VQYAKAYPLSRLASTDADWTATISKSGVLVDDIQPAFELK